MIDHARTILSFREFSGETADLIHVLMPDVRVERGDDALLCRREGATAHLARASGFDAMIVFGQRGVVQLHGRVDLREDMLHDIVADIVGYLCGAPLSSLSIYPHHDARPVVPKRRRRGPAWSRGLMCERRR